MDVWLPLQANPNSIDQGHYLISAGRLKPGVTAEAATARMRMAAEEFRRQFPDAMARDESAGVLSMQEQTVQGVRTILLVMLGAVAFVLLIACANVANLLLARAASRDKEIAIRTTIGAGRGRIVRQLLTESLMLVLLGGACGLALGYWGMKLLMAAVPGELPRAGELAAQSGLDLRVLGFTLLLSLVTGVLFGLVPALRISRAGLHSTLKEGAGRSSGSARHLRTRSVLVVSEVALGLVLLIGAGLLIRSAISMRAVNPGFDSRNVLTFKTSLSNEKYSKTAPIAQYMRQLVERVEALPGVSAAASVISVPTEPGPDLPFVIEGRQTTAGTFSGDELWRCASPHFFEALGIPLLRGRTFTESDGPGAAGVMIVNEAMARKYWPERNPIGQRVTIGEGLGPAFADRAREIVGIRGQRSRARSAARSPAHHVCSRGAGARRSLRARREDPAVLLGGARVGPADATRARDPPRGAGRRSRAGRLRLPPARPGAGRGNCDAPLHAAAAKHLRRHRAAARCDRDLRRDVLRRRAAAA